MRALRMCAGSIAEPIAAACDRSGAVMVIPPPNEYCVAGNETTVFAFMQSSSGNDYRLWRFVTNHAHVLACIATDPEARLRDIAATVGITERTAGQIVAELEQA